MPSKPNRVKEQLYSDSLFALPPVLNRSEVNTQGRNLDDDDDHDDDDNDDDDDGDRDGNNVDDDDVG